MKYYKISSDFPELTDFTLNLPNTFDSIGQAIQDNRNVVKKVATSYGEFVVKNYRRLYFFNRLAYSTFAKSKAERSYVISKELNRRGIKTPAHVAWLECYNWGFLSDSYFVSSYAPYKTLRETLNNQKISDIQKGLLYEHFFSFMVKLHKLGILHDDLSLGNILVMPAGNGYEFSLVDLNRIFFRKIGFRKGLANFHKLEIPKHEMDNLIRRYAMEAGNAPEAAIETFWADRTRALTLRRFRKTLRKYTLTPLENLFRQKFSLSSCRE